MFRSMGLHPEREHACYARRSRSGEYSFLKKAFDATMDVANATYQTKFIQGIRNGSLSPETYGSVSVLDAYYCYEAAKSIWHACGRAEEDSELQATLKEFYNSYAQYNAVFYSTWHVPAAQNVVPTNAFETYAKHERAVAETESPIYLLPALMPCYKLWSWMAYQIYRDPQKNPGVYEFWVEGNMGHEGESGSALLADEVIRHWVSEGKEFDEDKALEIFRTSIECEYRVFSSGGRA